MTSVYGVTRYGAGNQIERRLRELKDFPEGKVLLAARLLANFTLQALAESFRGAKNIMAWLRDCAFIIASTQNEVHWKTPLNLTCIQPYHQEVKRVIQTGLQRMTYHERTSAISRARQKSAFPPNFVHSLDSTHMMLTAIGCHENGMTFASVHDSFWTHACDIDRMNEILRDKFIELHKMPILDNLLADFKAFYPELNFPSPPELGTLNLDLIRKSPYFFD